MWFGNNTKLRAKRKQKQNPSYQNKQNCALCLKGVFDHHNLKMNLIKPDLYI